MVLQGSCAQPQVTILYPCGGHNSAEELKDIVIYIFLEEEPGRCPKAALLFLDCSSLVPAFPPFPYLPFWNSGKVKETE